MKTPTSEEQEYQTLVNKNNRNLKLTATGAVITVILALLLIKPYIYIVAITTLIGVIRGFRLQHQQDRQYNLCQTIPAT